MKNVLVLGAGLVSKPLVRYLLDVPDFNVKVASRTVSKAEKLIGSHPHGVAQSLNANDLDSLRKLIGESDLVISLLPYIYHVKVAEICIDLKKNMVTTSYISQEMNKLDERARDAEVLILNEIGLDPGIDHMSAKKIIDRVENNGGEIVSFRSYCGGLPALEASTNPFGYKFSWSPRGVLLAGKNSARYLENGQVVEIKSEELFKHYWRFKFDEIGEFEIYPNRDSLPYIEKYNLEHVKSMFRGTIRNIGWCETIYCIAKLGFLSEEKRDDLKDMRYNDLMRKIVNAQNGISTREAVKKFCGDDITEDILDRLEWLGLFSNDPIPEGKDSLLDILTERMLEKMSYDENERDMIILYHEFIAEYPDKKKKISSTLIDYGIPGGDSSMSRTVSLPAAISSKLILEGKINLKGVHMPVLPEIYNPVLDELEKLGIVCREEDYLI
jgi:saccharopine dehydrogenase-like NADP-dependent oxidoreductase